MDGMTDYPTADYYSACSVSGQYSDWTTIPHRFRPAAEAPQDDAVPPLMLRQVHSAIFHEIHSADDRDRLAAEPVPDGDGLICSVPGMTIGVVTADCVPVLISGDKHVAALHCGWRGLQRGLLDGALSRLIELGETAEQLRLATGPYIQPQAFEVGPEVIAAFVGDGRIDEPRWAFATTKGAGDRWYLDMGSIVATTARRFGLRKIAISRECTKTAKAADGSFRWPSYRRSGKGCGRIISQIALA